MSTTMSILKIRKWRLTAVKELFQDPTGYCASDLNAVRKKPKFRNI